MRKLTFALIVVLAVAMQLQPAVAQKSNNIAAIRKVVAVYSRSVVDRDSVAFYGLFNNGPVEWAGAMKDRSQEKQNQKSGPATNYFSSSYKSFFKYLYTRQSTEDKFDNVRIIEDGTVASVTMDYSFWADGKMTNWGNKYLGLIKIDGEWKITSVIYSIELTDYFEQPPLKIRQKLW